jgi:hypothetical protein
MWYKFLIVARYSGNRRQRSETYKKRRGQEVFNEPKFYGAVGVTHNAENHDGDETLLRK